MDIRRNLDRRADDRPYHTIGDYKAWRLGVADQFPADLIWICTTGGNAAYRHRILPLGEPSIAIKRRLRSDGSIADASLVICGPHSKPCWHQSGLNEEIIAVRLKPEFAAQTLNIEPAAFQNQAQTLTAAPMRKKFTTTEAALANASPQALARALLDDITRIAQGGDMREHGEHFTARRLRATNGTTPIRDIAASLSISERQLRRRFRNAVGCSPKDYARRLRVANAAILADAEANPLWAFIAAETGFHDQAHMIADFKALSGLTPRTLHRERRGDGS
ncbi:MAG: AraC family transcriptional regulator [Alphaproteobacteria bacterium]|nr:AraC family transcriptional regulator [Alphaproteobacteria bacterium]